MGHCFIRGIGKGHFAYMWDWDGTFRFYMGLGCVLLCRASRLWMCRDGGSSGHHHSVLSLLLHSLNLTFSSSFSPSQPLTVLPPPASPVLPPLSYQSSRSQSHPSSTSTSAPRPVKAIRTTRTRAAGLSSSSSGSRLWLMDGA